MRLLRCRSQVRASDQAARRCAVVTLCWWMAAAQPCAAHPGYPASVLAHIDTDGRIAVHLRHDVLAFALNETPALIGDEPMLALLRGAPEELQNSLRQARERLDSQLEIHVDQQLLRFELVEHPTIEQIEDTARRRDRLPIMLEFAAEARLPVNAASVSFAFPEVLGEVIFTIERPGAEPFTIPLRAGERTPEFDLVWPAEPEDSRGPGDDALLDNATQRPGLGNAAVAWRFIVLGFEHIVPRGLDHVLFVLGLFFLSVRARDLVVQLTMFTIAHSITLALATLGSVDLPAQVVEPVIAASIAFVALENLWTTRLHRWRPVIVFAFGLVHGLGFAGVLREAQMPAAAVPAALISFNIGVELGQLTVVALALALVGWWRSKPWYRATISLPSSAAIACLALYWAAERTL